MDLRGRGVGRVGLDRLFHENYYHLHVVNRLGRGYGHIHHHSPFRALDNNIGLSNRPGYNSLLLKRAF
jgi:hypothetical protein